MIAFFRSESHVCPEHEKLVQAYHLNMRRTLKFKPEIVERANHIFDEVAKKMHLKRKDVYFVGYEKNEVRTQDII